MAFKKILQNIMEKITNKSKINKSESENSIIEENEDFMEKHEAVMKKKEDVIEKYYEIIKPEYEEILEVVRDKDKPSYFLGQGIDIKILDKYKDKVEYKPLRRIAKMLVENSFCEGNEVAQMAILDYIYNIFYNRINNKKYGAFESVVLLALKALHFEGNSENSDNYISINDNTCRDAVLNCPTYKKALEQHPFEEEKYIKKFVEDIKISTIFWHDCTSRSKLFFYIHLGEDNEYFCDAVCNLVWKEAKKRIWRDDNGNDITNSQNIEDVIKILWTFLSMDKNKILLKFQESYFL